MRGTLLPALAAAAAAVLALPAAAHAHALFKPGWQKGKTPTEIVERQRTAIAHDRAVIRVFEARFRPTSVKHHGIVRWHQNHLRTARRDLAEKLAALEAKRAAAAAAVVAPPAAPPASTGSAGAGGYASSETALCESGGNPAAVSADGTYRGKWQFDQATWDAHAPAGWQGVDPAAAPEAVQDQAAANVAYDAWPNC